MTAPDAGDLADDAGNHEDDTELGPRPPEEILAELADTRIRELRQLGDEESVIRVTAALGRAIELLRGMAGEDDPEFPA